MNRAMCSLLSAPTINVGRSFSRRGPTERFTSISKTGLPLRRSVSVLKPSRDQKPSINGAVEQQTRELGQELANHGGAGHQLIGRQPKGYQYTEQAYLTARTRRVAQHFPSALGLDDFLNRLEIALFAYGFTGENCIGALITIFPQMVCTTAASCLSGFQILTCLVLGTAMSNMCRDEITATLKQKLDGVFGSSFNTNGLGGVLTCGVTGVKAGLSHSPVSEVRPPCSTLKASLPHVTQGPL